MKEVKIKKSQKNKIKKLEKELKADSESDEPIIKATTKIRKPKKKTYVESESESENEKVVIKNNTKQNYQTDYRRLTTYI